MHKVSDRTFLMHLGGTIEMASKHPIRNRDDLSMVYTPGVARVCEAIAANPEDARRLTVKRNSVAVVTDGSAVLGLGNIGPAAALPVMEGKSALFKRFAGIDAWPLCLDTQDPDLIVEIVRAVSPGFAGINLEDISAPRCFEIEARLREILDIPVFHDDQHGTAIVVLAALTNALRVVNKDLADVRIVMSGAGAAGTAILRLLLEAGARDVVVADVEGVVYRDRPGLHPSLYALAEATNPGGLTGTLHEAHRGRRRVHRRLGAQRARRRRRREHGRRRDRLRAGQPGPRDRPGRGPPARRRRGDRPVGLPQPDQQRARLPRRLPRAARRVGQPDRRRAAGRGRRGDRARGDRRRAQRQLHHPERLPRRRAHRGGEGGPHRGRGEQPGRPSTLPGDA